MQDPKPENITGEKSVQHVVKHEINWGHVALAVAAIYVVTQVAGWVGQDSETDQQQGDEIEIEEVGENLLG